jgi:hypothetical protein
VAVAWLVFAPMPRLQAVGQATVGLTAAPRLARVYDAIFDAAFDRVPGLLGETCPPAPREACLLLESVSLWWQIRLDPRSTVHDARFHAGIDAAIAAAAAWTVREPQRAEAWFYLGAAYGARAQWQVLRERSVPAARDGKRIKDAMERALRLDPAMHDAHFGIGLYRYYADVAPLGIRLLRWLLLLPGGDRARGLDEMLSARDRGQLVQSEADYQLHVLYLWYEHEPERAVELLAGLQARHPRNPHFLQTIAEVEDTYLFDAPASLHTYEALLDSARSGLVAEAPLAAAVARLGAARQLDRMFEADAAVEHLRVVVSEAPTAPVGAVAEARALLQRASDRLARPAYRLSIQGWRALERGELEPASRALTQSLSLAPDDPVTRYRYATLLFAQHQEDAALVVLAEIHKRQEAVPATIYARACVDAARVHERRGDTRLAIDLYRSATTVFGGDRRVKAFAQERLTRLSTTTR